MLSVIIKNGGSYSGPLHEWHILARLAVEMPYLHAFISEFLGYNRVLCMSKQTLIKSGFAQFRELTPVDEVMIPV